jgi:hypothetical protein
VSENVSVKEASASFTTFFRKHGATVPVQLRQLALSLVNDVAGAYHGTSKKETALITEIKNLLTHVL